MGLTPCNADFGPLAEMVTARLRSAGRRAEPAAVQVLVEAHLLPGALMRTAGLTFVSKASAEGWSDFKGPFLIDPQKGARLWYAGSRVWRSEDRAESFTAASFKFNELPAVGLARALAVSGGKRSLQYPELPKGSVGTGSTHHFALLAVRSASDASILCAILDSPR